MRMITSDLVDRLAGHKTLGAAPREELAWLASRSGGADGRYTKIELPSGVHRIVMSTGSSPGTA